MGREGEVVGELVRDFEREHPGIRVQVQQIPWTAAHEKLLTAHVGGSLPDVGQLGNSWISEFGTLKSLEPLDPWLQGKGELGLPARGGYPDQLARTAPCPMVPEWEEIATRVYEQADRAIRGATSADSALATLDHLVDKMLEKRRWLASRRAAGAKKS